MAGIGFDAAMIRDADAGLKDRLGSLAADAGARLGVKFTNTLLVKNHRRVFTGQPEMYLSGPPLHVLAMHLVRRFRRHFADAYEISFSGGIDRTNFSDAVALGLVPVTVCTDLLKPRGYARGHEYLGQLAARMRGVGASTIDDFTRRAYGLAVPGSPIGAARCANTEHYVATLASNPRYGRERNTREPKKVGSGLAMFDCLACDICIPVCPNDANFVFLLPRDGIPVVKARPHASGWSVAREEPLRIEEAHQIGTFADFCNECGNCETFCPEHGAPYQVKPRFFRTHEAWASTALDGFWVERRHGCDRVSGRFGGRAFRAVVRDGLASFRGDGFAVRFDPADPERTIRGMAHGSIDLTFFYLMDALRASVLSRTRINYINSLH